MNKREYNKQYYQKNKEHHEKLNRQWREEHKEEKLAYDRQYHKNNLEKKKKQNKQWHKDNPEYRKQWYLKHREREILRAKKYNQKYKKIMKENFIQRTYGLSHEDWLGIWNNQDGKCAICGKSFENPFDACIDHCHETNEIRGFLCRRCNLGLGHFNDDIEIIKKAIKYLKEKKVI